MMRGKNGTSKTVLVMTTKEVEMGKKLTEIGPFSVGQKPVRDGVYKRMYHQKNKMWCLFSKGTWYCSSYTYSEAKRESWRSNFQDLPWWGVEAK